MKVVRSGLAAALPALCIVALTGQPQKLVRAAPFPAVSTAIVTAPLPPGATTPLKTQIALAAADAAATPAAPMPPADIANCLSALLVAITADNYANFISAAPFEPAVKKAMTPRLFKNVVAEYAPRLKRGYATTYMGVLRMKGYAVHMWKMSFRDGSDDVLIELSVKSCHLGGLSFR